jgi:NTE family protein
MAPSPDGLAAPISFDARRGAGDRRALVLGGGGVVFVAWLAGYLGELATRGVAVVQADRIVGTSAGSILAAVVAGDRLRRFGRVSRWAAHRPGLIARMAPAAGLNPSAQRAMDLFEAARDAEPATIRAIGAASLAADTPPALLLPVGAALITQTMRWPGDRLTVTAVDADSGERLVLTRAGGVPLLRAVAASCTVPGVFAPQPVGARRAIDGGVSGTGTHADLVAGAQRALVCPAAIALEEPRLTMVPDGVQREIAALRATGTEVEVRYARLASDIDLMDPAAAPAALALGVTQGIEDADELRAFWRAR